MKHTSTSRSSCFTRLLCQIASLALALFAFAFVASDPHAAAATAPASSTNAATAIPRPEHPRPDQFRADWLSLNGPWQFEIDHKGDGEERGLTSGKNLASTIIVPFCPESKLSGIGHTDHMKNVWYRRTFEVPAALRNDTQSGQTGRRVRLHFGAVDYQAWVWINGNLAGEHTGGQVSFNFDITPFLRDGANEIVVRVFDDTASGDQPLGKQAKNVPGGPIYTRTTGIWQTVWLEAVASTFIENFSIVPDPDHSRVIIEAALNGNDRNLILTAEAFADGEKVGEESVPASWRNNRLVLNLSEKKLWEPATPFLYDLKFTLSRLGDHPQDDGDPEKLDEVSSYFGLRKVTIEGRAILINGKRVFQRLILDQGYYPDGLWTAPSDAELRADIERSLAAGYNGARLHQKVFEPRFLYWADKLGYLVWGEYANWGFNNKPENIPNVVNEWTEILLRDRNHPAIIGWCPSNETPPAAGVWQNILWHQTRAIDSTRPILETSGWTHTIPHPEVLDDHDYNQNPDTFRRRWMEFFDNRPQQPMPPRYATTKAKRRKNQGAPFMVSEFGGIKWSPEDGGGWGYGKGPATIEEFYTRYAGLVDALLDNPNMFGFCYTQLTDVEKEVNGLYFYDRRPKFDMARLRAITSREAAYEKTGPTAPIAPRAVTTRNWKVVVGAAPDGKLSKPWRYTTTGPAAKWNQPGFSDSAWQTGLAPFGRSEPGRVHRTLWNTSDIWLRQEFDYNGAPLNAAAIVAHYDEDTEVYVNGKLVWSRAGFVTAYDMFDITDTLKAALKQGRNTLAVHTRQTVGGQFIDLALLVERAGE